jgi:hypothetical protein
MPGLKLVLPTAFTDTSLPVLRDDPVLTAGSLLLIEPAHPARPMAAGIPAHGSAVPNIAHAEAAALIGGSPALGTLDNSLKYAAAWHNTSKGKLERSAKGGIHGIVSKAVSLAAGEGATIGMNSSLWTYLLTNKAHSIYVSFWDRLTRINTGSVTSNGAQEHGAIGANTSTAAILSHRADAWQSSTGATIGSTKLAPNTVGPRFGNANVTANSGFTSATAGDGGPLWGALNGYNSAVIASRNGFWPSFVFYRFYIEDLTVSGRTYAQADAADYAEYTKQVLTAGGRYYGDTFTDPATIP